MKSFKLKSLSVPDLLDLKEQLDKILSARVETEKERLHAMLARLDGAGKGSSATRRKRGHSLKGRKIPPKYRNPADAAETWTGRGMRPRWLAEAMRDGKPLKDFLIADQPAPARRKAGRPRGAKRKSK
jgi:DNA-binding protein H-NS